MERWKPIAAAVAACFALVWAADASAADQPVASTLDLSRVAGSGSGAAGADQTLVGTVPRGRAGSAVAFVGDVNHDELPDYAVGAPLAGGRGDVTVVYGKPTDGQLNLADVTGARGFHITGPQLRSEAGTSIAPAGDVNGDGADDILVGVPRARFSSRGTTGAVYVVFGGREGDVSLRTPEDRAVAIVGANDGDATGAAVSSVLDLDNDGRQDLVIGAPGAGAAIGRPGAGATFVVYSSGLANGADLAKLAGRGYRIDGAAAGDRSGSGVSSTADLSGDGRSEVLLGAPGSGGGAGAAFVVWGKPLIASTTVDLAQLGPEGFALVGSPGERAGTAVAGLGDTNGDGLGDIAVGAPGSSWNGRAGAGALYIVPGRGDVTPALLGTSGIRVGGGDPHEGMGIAVASAGYVDDDRSADVLVGLSSERALDRVGAGGALLLLTGRLAAGDVDGGLLGAAAVRLAGPEPDAQSGRALAGGVDANGDGRDDVLIGNRRAQGLSGSASVVLLPELKQAPATPERTGTELATNVEAVIDDSPSMAGKDPGGVMRRQALELTLQNPANASRVFGAVEFGARAHEVLPPLRIGDAALAGDRSVVLSALLAERLRNNAGATNLDLGFAAATLSNPAAQARIFMTDGGSVRNLAGFGDVPTYVLAFNVTSASVRDRLNELATNSRGALFTVADGGELQAAVGAIDALLRGDAPVQTVVTASPEVQEVSTSTGQVGAEVKSQDATVAFQAVAPATRIYGLRLLLTWNDRHSDFDLANVRIRARGGTYVRVSRGQLKHALERRRWQPLSHGLSIRGRKGRTFIAFNIRGLDARTTGKRAVAALGSRVSYYNATRRSGSGRTRIWPALTYQRRPTL